MNDEHLIDERLSAAVKGVPCLEPLVISDRDGKYEILDGHLRHEIPQALGGMAILCLLVKE